MRSLIIPALLVAAFSFSTTGTVSAAETAAQCFERLDRNKDNCLSVEELSNAEFLKLENLKQLPYEDLSIFDEDKNGTVTREELLKGVFGKIDKKKNGKIDRGEFDEFYSSLKP